MALPLLIAGGAAAIAALSAAARAGLEWAGDEPSAAQLAWQTWWPWAEQPTITPPDPTPIAPMVSPTGMFTPETMFTYTTERKLRDIEIIQQAAAGNGIPSPKPPTKLPNWLMPVIVGVGAIAMLSLVRR